MIVRSIKANHGRKSGRVAITFEVEPQTWLNMGRSAKAAAHPDTLDYVAGRINAAFADDAPPPSGAPKASSDTDDDLPF